jgi:hypothetical protein
MRPRRITSPDPRWRRLEMLDALMIAIGTASFALLIGYVVLCEKL